MKKKITLLTAVLTLLMFLAQPVGLRGQTRTQINWVASEQGYSNGEAIESVVFDNNVSAIFNKGTNGNAPKYYNTGAAIRCYGGNYFTVSTTQGNLTEIALSFASGEGSNAITTDIGNYEDGTWTGSATSVTFTIGGTSGHRRIASFAITYGSGGTTETVATPTFTPVEGTYTEAQNVTISCATAGASVYYTTDGTIPVVAPTGINGTLYTAPIAISETTTVKAIAVKDGMNNSSVATATYTIQATPTLITIAQARALEVNDYAMVQGVITFIDARNVYVQDETAGIDLYLNSAVNTLNLGDKVQAYGKVAIYKGLVELSGINPNEANEFSVLSTGNTLPLAVKTIAEINADAAGTNMLQSTRVQIVDATVGTINTTNNTPITQGENSLNIYKMPVVDGLAEGDVITVTGIIGCFNTPQLRVASANDVTVQSAPTTYAVSIAEGIANGTVTANPTQAVEGTTITVTATPASGYELTSLTYSYTGVNAIDITEAKQFNMPAADVTINATFTATAAPAQETAYTLITNANALVVGEKYLIVGIKGDTYKAMGKQANNNRPSVDVTPANNVITITPATQAGEDAVYELTLGQAEGNWTLYDAANGGYLYAASATSNYLRTQAENDANGQWTIEIAQDGVATIKAQGTNSRNWMRLNNNGSPFSCYANGQLDVYLYKAGDVPAPPQPTYYSITVANVSNGTLEVSKPRAQEGETITVTATPAEGYELTSLTYEYAGATAIDITEAKQFTMPAADVTVNAVFTELSSVATPVLSLAEGSYLQAQEVSITCATEGATIYYTLDGNDPTPNSSVYSQPITVSATTTVKAMAVKEGMNNSAIASATYTIIPMVTIAEARALNTNEYALVQGIVTFIDGRNIYIQDETAGIDLYLNNNTVPSTLALGDLVMAYGKKAVYNGLIELSGIAGNNDNQFVIVSSGNQLPVAVKTIAEILEDYQGANLLQSTRVQIVDAVIGAINTNNNTPITQGESTMNIYRMPVVEGLLEDDFVTVTGVIGCYNGVQLRVASVDDVEFTHPAYPALVAEPSSLAGFTYVEGNGPSAVKSFVITGSNLSTPAYIFPSENFQISSLSGNNFIPESRIKINSTSGNFSYNIYVRLKADLEIGSYSESLSYCCAETDTAYVTLTGSVVAEGGQTGDYVRIADLSQIGNGAKVVFAARFDENANDYYAMTAQATGKPTGVLFTSVAGTNGETLPGTIADEENTYCWTVTTDGTNYTFTNAEGDVLGYTSSTNFANGGDNTAWSIVAGTSEEGAMVPDYSAFVISNVNNAVRAIALNSNHNFGPYHTQNMTANGYNFFIDIFATGGSGTLVCAAPTFSPEGGTYYEAQMVSLSCATADATIHYTLDGTNPTANSAVYSEPIAISENTTIKAMAVKEGYEDSQIAEAQYVIVLGAVVIFNQDWEGDMNGWTFVTVEGSKPWTIGQYQGNHYANANGYNGGVNEQWCISPAFNLSSYSDVTLTFLNAKNYTGPDMQVFFSNDYDGADPTTANWTELTYEMSTGSYAWTESGVIGFDGFTGTNCYIGFKYTSTEDEAAAWEVDDIMLMGFTSDSYLTVNPTALTGFTHVVEQGPSAAQSFTLSAANIGPAPGGTTGSIIMQVTGAGYEISLDNETFTWQIDLNVNGNLAPTPVYVRLNGTEVGDYSGSVDIYASSSVEATVTLSGTVTEPVQGGDWNRIGSLADLADGDRVVIASRYDATVGDGYYAMTAGVSGKPDGVLFTSVNSNGVETLPDAIVADIETFVWDVTLNDTILTLVNAAGDTLGYSSSTNFSGNTSTDWAITFATSGDNAMVPNYAGFVITNVETPNRGIAKNASNKFGAYSTSNINNGDYNFYLDLFVQGGTTTPTVATPVFSVASGTYYQDFEVEITCATEGAVIYYTNDGSDPTAESMVYGGPLHIDADVTLKAIAMMEGYDNSNIATANYVLMLDMIVIFNQDWEGEMDGWTFVTVEGNKPWSVSSYGGNQYAYANGYNDEVDNEQWCISPAFDLTPYMGTTLTFMNAKNYSGPDLELYFSNDYNGQDPTDATWQPLEYNMSEGGYNWAESGEISLDGFTGESCYIGFRYISTIEDGAAAWEIDDILLYATSDTTSVSEFTMMDVNLWNHNNEIFVENNTNTNLQMVVLDLLGRQVFVKPIGMGSVRFTHNLNQGLYIVTLQNNKERMSSKMVVR